MTKQKHPVLHQPFESFYKALYLPCCCISTEVTESVLEPVVYLVKCELLIRWLDDGLKQKEIHYQLCVILFSQV